MMRRATLRHLLATSLALAGCADGCDPAPLVGFDAGPPDGGVDAGRCPAARTFCEDGAFWACADDGVTRTELDRCAEACDRDLGCVACIPGTGRCEGDVSARCAPDGSRFDRVRDCAAAGVACLPTGFCDDECGDAEARDSNVGCRFLAVPLLTYNFAAYPGYDFGVLVGNAALFDADVTVRLGGRRVASRRVAAGAVERIVLPWIPEMSLRFGGDVRSELRWESFVTPDGAYEITSTRPVTVFQFSPLGPDDPDAFPLYSMDASVLLPTHTLAGAARVLTQPPASDGRFVIDTPGYLAVVGAGDREVTVTVRADVALLGATGGRWADAAPGEPVSFALAPGEVAHVMPPRPPRCDRFLHDVVWYRFPADAPGGDWHCKWPAYDPTGARVEADGPVAVFGGHVSADVPIGMGGGRGPHLETQIPPEQTWREDHRVVPAVELDPADDAYAFNVLRVLARDPATTVTVDPPQEGFAGGPLEPGEVLDFRVVSPCVVRGSAPILVGQMTTGMVRPIDDGFTLDLGDVTSPSLAIVPPVDQYRADYVVALPGWFDGPPLLGNVNFRRANHLAVVRAAGVPVTLDDAPLDAAWSAVGDGYEQAVVKVSGGVHRLRSDAPFGLMAFGLHANLSYLFAGGTDLRRPELR